MILKDCNPPFTIVTILFYVSVVVAPFQHSINFTSARPGDSLFCPFECGKCTLFWLKGISSRSGDKNHQILLYLIIHSNMDAFWSCYTGTVTELTWMFYEVVSLGRAYYLQIFLQPMCPFLPEYDRGMQSAIGVLHRSKRPGKHKAKLIFSQNVRHDPFTLTCS